MQWLLFLQAVEPTPKEQADNSPRTLVIYNTLGHKLEFLSAPAFVALRTIGPFVEGQTRKKAKDVTTRFVLDQGFLGLGLEQAAAAMLRMHRSGVKGPFMSGTGPFGEDVIGKCRKADESWQVTPAEERALAGSFPGIAFLFQDRPGGSGTAWYSGSSAGPPVPMVTPLACWHQQHRISLGH